MPQATAAGKRVDMPEVVPLAASEHDDVLSLLPAPVRRLHNNRRILVVDDFREGAAFTMYFKPTE